MEASRRKGLDRMKHRVEHRQSGTNKGVTQTE